MFHIYILNTHLCTFWYKFSFLQGVLGRMGVRLKRGEDRWGGWGQSHFPDCLVLRERGEASTSRALAPPRPQTFPLAPLRSQWQSWVTAVESINGGLSSETTSLSGVRADDSSLIPLWDQNPRRQRRRRQSSTIFYLERELELQKKDKAAIFVIDRLMQWYLCCPPLRLLTSLAFGLLDCCTSAPPPAAGNGVRRQRPRPELHLRVRGLPSDSPGWPAGSAGETEPVC